MTTNNLHAVVNRQDADDFIGTLEECKEVALAEAKAGNTRAKIVSRRSMQTVAAQVHNRVARPQFDVRLMPVAQAALRTLSSVTQEEIAALHLGKSFHSIMIQATQDRPLSSHQYSLIIGWAAQVVSYRKSSPDVERMVAAVTA
jgi:hypothetical protein